MIITPGTSRREPPLTGAPMLVEDDDDTGVLSVTLRAEPMVQAAPGRWKAVMCASTPAATRILRPM